MLEMADSSQPFRLPLFLKLIFVDRRESRVAQKMPENIQKRGRRCLASDQVTEFWVHSDHITELSGRNIVAHQHR